MKKNLIIYFSLTENTDFIAKKLSKDLDADILELKPTLDLKKWGFLKMFIGGAQVLLNILPKIEYRDININDYENIIIGSPVWAGSYVPALKAFFKKEKIEDKNIGLFVCCNGGEGHTIKELKENLDGNNFLASAVFVDTLKNEKITKEKYDIFLNELTVIV